MVVLVYQRRCTSSVVYQDVRLQLCLHAKDTVRHYARMPTGPQLVRQLVRQLVHHLGQAAGCHFGIAPRLDRDE